MELSLASRVFGFIGSLVLTLVAFFFIVRPEYFHLSLQTVVIVIFALALVQFALQSFCFIHLWEEKGTRWNLIVFLSTLSVVLIIIIFSIWVMTHLDKNMMPPM
jgi:cytochrome o ubiquinol oxidase operon protein cyoD